MSMALEVKGVTKRFPGVLANDSVSFELHKGEVHTLLGENGAGKTTLMNILFGLYQPDEGEILVKHQPVRIHSPADAIRLGIGMVHQHFMLVPTLTVFENIILGQEPTWGPFLLGQQAVKKIDRVSEELGIKVNPLQYIWELSVGQQQRVEILKALYRGAEILILDEPTSVLTSSESYSLFEILRSMTAQGKSIIFISHKLKEVMAVSDRVTVLRRGKKIGTVQVKDTSERELAQMMVGRDVILSVSRTHASENSKPVVATLREARVLSNYGRAAVKDVNLDVHAGEIVGIAGVDGNGQSELAEVMAGLRVLEHGSFHLNGEEITHTIPSQRTEKGLWYVPADRKERGAVTSLSITSNAALKHHRWAPFSNKGVLSLPVLRDHATKLVKEYDVRCPSIDVQAGKLSGGNLQKLILARETCTQPKFLIIEQPTRGLDIGATDDIRALLLRQKEAGSAILLISADLDEVLALSDRVIVMYEGSFVQEFMGGKVDMDKLSLAMAGVTASGSEHGNTQKEDVGTEEV